MYQASVSGDASEDGGCGGADKVGTSCGRCEILEPGRQHCSTMSIMAQASVRSTPPRSCLPP